MYALIRNGVVRNVIVATGDFIATILANWDAAIDISDLDPKPGIGWTYNGTTFSPPPPGPPPPPVFDRMAAARTTWANAPAAVKTQALTAIAIALGIADS